jgi:heme A synthase
MLTPPPTALEPDRMTTPNVSLAHPLIVSPAASSPRRVARHVWRAAVWGYAIAIAATAAFAGVFVFVRADLIEVHKMGAHVTGTLLIVALVSAFAGRLDRRARRQTLGLLGLLILQGMLVHLLVVSPWIAALHPANALLLFWAAFSVARGSGEAVSRAEGAASELRWVEVGRAALRPEPA